MLKPDASARVPGAAAWTVALAVLLAPVSTAAAPDNVAPLTRYSATSWTEKDGLPSQSVWPLAQDRDGYLWVGTSKGLVRFDGIRFVPVAPEDVPLTHLGVMALHADSEGGVWRSFWGLGRLDRITGRRVVGYGPREGLPNAPVLAVLQDREGTVWAGGGAGLARLRDDRWHSVALGDDNRDLSVRSLYEDRAGNLWVSTSLGVFRRSSGSREFHQVSSDSSIARGFAEQSNGSVWVIDQNAGFQQLSGPDVSFSPQLDSGAASDTWRIVSDSQANIWIATNGGLMVIRSPPGLLPSVIRSNPGLQATLSCGCWRIVSAMCGSAPAAA